MKRPSSARLSARGIPILFFSARMCESAPKPLQLTGTDGQPTVNLSPGILTYFSNLNVPLFLLGAVAFFMLCRDRQFTLVVADARQWTGGGIF